MAAQRQARFWALIDVLEGSSDDAAVARLEGALARCSGEEIESFARSLHDTMRLLEGEPHHSLIGKAAPGGPSSDSALFLRCAIVAAGQRRFEEAISTPRLVSGDWDTSGADLLSGVASSAYGAVTGDVLIASDPADRPPHLPWVAFYIGGSDLKPMRVWDAFIEHVQSRRISQESAWIQWRADNSIKQVRLFVHYGRGARHAGAEKFSVGVRRGIVEANVIRDREVLPLVPTVRPIRAEVDWLMRVLTDRMSRSSR